MGDINRVADKKTTIVPQTHVGKTNAAAGPTKAEQLANQMIAYDAANRMATQHREGASLANDAKMMSPSDVAKQWSTDFASALSVQAQGAISPALGAAKLADIAFGERDLPNGWTASQLFEQGATVRELRGEASRELSGALDRVNDAFWSRVAKQALGETGPQAQQLGDFLKQPKFAKMVAAMVAQASQGLDAGGPATGDAKEGKIGGASVPAKAGTLYPSLLKQMKTLPKLKVPARETEAGSTPKSNSPEPVPAFGEMLKLSVSGGLPADLRGLDIDALVQAVLMHYAADQDLDAVSVAQDLQKCLDIKKALREAKTRAQGDQKALEAQMHDEYERACTDGLIDREKMPYEDFAKWRQVAHTAPQIDQNTGAVTYYPPKIADPNPLNAQDIPGYARPDSEAIRDLQVGVDEAQAAADLTLQAKAVNDEMATLAAKAQPLSASDQARYDELKTQGFDLLGQIAQAGYGTKTADEWQVELASRKTALTNAETQQKMQPGATFALPDGAGPSAGLTTADLAALDAQKIDDELQNQSGFGELIQLKLQQIMEKRSQAFSAISNLMKSSGSTAKGIIDNLK